MKSAFALLVVAALVATASAAVKATFFESPEPQITMMSPEPDSGLESGKLGLSPEPDLESGLLSPEPDAGTVSSSPAEVSTGNTWVNTPGALEAGALAPETTPALISTSTAPAPSTGSASTDAQKASGNSAATIGGIPILFISAAAAAGVLSFLV